MNEKDIAVIIPIYLPVLSDTDRKSLEQCLKVLSIYNIIIIKPGSLNIDKIIDCYNLKHIETFPDEWFASLRSYNKLVLSELFYERFQNYMYILIYQLDAYVFRDELLYWAKKGYDYIGAPWLPYKRRHLGMVGQFRLTCQRFYCKFFNKEAFKSDKYYAYLVGNGGFSLRKVNTMIKVVSYYKEKIDCLLADEKPFYPEDIFLLLELTDKKVRLRKPHFREALRFSVEENPEWAYRCNNGQHPFGCHAWYCKDYFSFWETIIK